MCREGNILIAVYSTVCLLIVYVHPVLVVVVAISLKCSSSFCYMYHITHRQSIYIMCIDKTDYSAREIEIPYGQVLVTCLTLTINFACFGILSLLEADSNKTFLFFCNRHPK